MSRHSAATTIVLLLLGRSLAYAQVDFSTLAVQPGDIVYVKQASGVEVSGPVVRVSPSSLIIDGREFTPANTQQIDRRGDSVKNGALIGAAVLGGWCAAVCGQGVTSGRLIPVIAINAGWGALVGMLLDGSRTGRTTVFRRSTSVLLVPSVTRARGALSITVAF